MGDLRWAVRTIGWRAFFAPAAGGSDTEGSSDPGAGRRGLGIAERAVEVSGAYAPNSKDVTPGNNYDEIGLGGFGVDTFALTAAPLPAALPLLRWRSWSNRLWLDARSENYQSAFEPPNTKVEGTPFARPHNPAGVMLALLPPVKPDRTNGQWRPHDCPCVVFAERRRSANRDDLYSDHSTKSPDIAAGALLSK